MVIYQQVAQYIQRESLLQAEQGLIVGVSGGADSLCLLDCLHHLGYGPIVAHLDHGLRVGSQDDQEFVRRLAESYGLPFESKRLEAPPKTGSIEEQARLLRYQFLVDVAARHKLRAIAVGHTSDDQVETVLMHLLRGSGSAGLSGMRPRTPLDDWIGLERTQGLSLVRPLLESKRHNTQAHCQAIGLKPLRDPSNDDLSFFRNRLRHELIPALESYNPGITDVLARTAKLMTANSALVAELVEANWNDWIRQTGDSAYAVHRQRLLEAPIALQRAAVRRLIGRMRPALRDVGFEAVERVLEGVRGSNGAQRSIIGGLELIPLQEEAVIREPGARIPFPDKPQLQSTAPQALQVPGSWDLAEGWSIEAHALDANDSNWPCDAQFDRDHLSGQMMLRTPAIGDRISPAGMSGSVKLSDLFINRKVHRLARQYWPVISDGLEVLWVPALHRSRAASVSQETKRRVAFRLHPPAG
jgi:tRNA(Ile)-lysidine synthase